MKLHSSSLTVTLFQVFILISWSGLAAGQTCSDVQPCLVGCCNKNNACGFGPDFCSPEAGCKHGCDSKAECGKFAPEGKGDCPLNVCCSKWGFCGTTEEFCNSECQPNSEGKGCEPVQRPTCPENTDALSYRRRIGYYQLFNAYKQCGMKPEELPVEPLTHLHLAFINFDSSFKITGEHIALVPYAALLKLARPGLKIQIAVGGWAFNDPPTSTLFSEMVSTKANRDTFINSAITYIRKWGLDGIDLDWEYPSATDRGGNPDVDAANYVLLCAELRQAMNRENPGWELSVTLPTSYWYLKGFDIQRMQKHVDYFGMMTYDLYGMWDKENKWTGPYLRGHTDLVDIERGMDLLWRNNIQPEKVVFGLAFYGRSFTMENSGCEKPDGICRFSDGGEPGECSDTTGILIYQEIASRNNSLDTNPAVYDPETSVKYITYGGNQWISFDDAQSFEAKKRYLSKRCLNGLMIWAIDQDTDQFDAMNGLMGDYSALQFKRGDQDKETLKKIARGMGAYTGQDCFVTPKCYTESMSSISPTDPNYFCPPGFMQVASAHAPLQTNEKYPVPDVCPKGSQHHICCPTDALPKNCQWLTYSDPKRPCGASCGKTQFRLNVDSFLDSRGNQQCYQGTRPFCCDSTELISGCEWQSCQGPLAPGSDPSCPSHLPEFLGWRMDKRDGTRWCAHEFGTGNLYDRFKSPLCCPKTTGWGKCHWGNSPTDMKGRDIFTSMCIPGTCEAGSVKVAEALDPAPAKSLNTAHELNCDKMVIPPGRNPYFPLCCEPGSRLSPKWPVDPKLLWGDRAYTDPENSDVAWVYDPQQNNNDRDFTANPMDEGDDAYGFVMLNGPDHSLDTSFGTSYTVVRRDEKIPAEKLKRRYVTSNQTELEQNFDHKSETLYVYCNYQSTDARCEKIFKLGAEDTIIGLPAHVGDGPFARVVSMEPVSDEDLRHQPLPQHHIRHRDTYGLQSSGVFRLEIDYSFDAITPKRQDQPVLMRIDYTNLLDYWDQVTDEPASKRKRSDQDAAEGRRLKRDIAPGYSQVDWLEKVQRSVRQDKILRRRSHEMGKATVGNVGFEFEEVPERAPEENQVDKRWFGFFAEWLRRLTTFSRGEEGNLPLGFARVFTIFKATAGCPGKSYQASLQMDLEANIQMDMTYAYYLSGTLIPPSKPEMFFYFGMQPDAYLGLRLYGNAKYTATTKRKKIIDTLSYPGLAIRGIAAVGPTLDVYGELIGYISIKGEVRAGTKITFGRGEAYWPQNADADRYMTLLGMESQNTKAAPETIAPTFDVNVRIDAGLSLIVQPEANVGIKIGGGKLTGGREIVNAQISGYLKTVLAFTASGTVTNNPWAWSYSYGVYFYYNIGYKAVASIIEVFDWAISPREAYVPDRRIDLYGPVTGTIPLTGPDSRKRAATLHHDGYVLADGPYELESERLQIAGAINDKQRTPQLPGLPLSGHLEPRHVPKIDGRSRHKEDGLFTGSVVLPEILLDIPVELNSSALSRRQGGSQQPPGTPEFPEPDLKCNNDNTAEVIIPELRFNCALMGTVSVTRPDGTTVTRQGLCQPINALSDGPPKTLTFLDNDSSQANRDATCPSIAGAGFCNENSKQLRVAMGVGQTVDKYTLQCDEYPPASSEEGGTWMGLLGVSRSRTCVPSMQNELYAGNCIGQLIGGNFASNWGRMDPRTPKDKDGNEVEREDNWVEWGTVTKWRSAGVTGQNNQELVVYPRNQPPPVGMRTDTTRNPKMAWMFRRNYTFSLNTGNVESADTWWSTTGQTFNGAYGAIASTDRIMCAVNNFGQDTLFRYRTDTRGSYNGLCLEPRERPAPSRGWPYTRYHHCMITYGAAGGSQGSQGSQKRDGSGGLGTYGNWQVEKIEYGDPVEFPTPTEEHPAPRPAG